MKRSEAIKLIMDVFEFQGTGIPMRYKDALAILNTLERCGMKPPLTKRCPVLLTTVHTWEKEEENET